MQLKTPVSFFVFNRPHLTEETFSRIREQRPSRLLVVADGPRPDHATDHAQVVAVRRIVQNVDWPCDVERLYAEENLGLRERMSTGLSWVFTRVDRAIVLEDDCVPNTTFFRFCEELLDYYEDDPRVGMITGNNFQGGNWRGDGSYYFSKYPHCWGWATWARAWQLHDPSMPYWPAMESTPNWAELIGDPFEQQYWARIFDMVTETDFESWAYPWTATCFYYGLLTATPNVNLVANIGFGPDATHTRLAKSPAVETQPMGSIRHPDVVRRNREAESHDFEHVYGGRELRERQKPWGLVRWVARRIARRLRFAYRTHLKRSL